MDSFDLHTFWIFTTLLMVLTAATVVGQMLRRQTELGVNPAVVEQFNLRVRSWWMLTAMLAVGFLLGPSVTVALFGGLSFWALREFITPSKNLAERQCLLRAERGVTEQHRGEASALA